MFPLTHGLLQAVQSGDVCLTSTSWTQPFTTLDLSAVDNRTHGMVVMNETDFAYWNRTSRAWQMYRRSAGVYSSVGSASAIVSFQLISADKLTENRIVFYDHNVRDIRTIEWDDVTETWSVVDSMTSDGPAISETSPIPVAGMTEGRCAIASNSTGLVCYESTSEGPWTQVGNAYTSFGDPAVSLTNIGMVAIDADTVLMLAESTGSTGPGLLVLRFDGTDWNLIQSITNPDHFRPSSMTKLNNKTFAIVGDVSGGSRELQMYCFDGGVLSQSGVAETLTNNSTPIASAFNDTWVGYIDDDGMFKTYQRN